MIGNKPQIALDTVEAIAILNGDDGVYTWAEAYSDVYLPVPVVGELRFGALNSGKVEEHLRRMEKLVARCIVLNADHATTHFYAEIRLSLRRRGKPIPPNDLWTAAICRQHNLPLASLDEHFTYVDGLVVIRRK